MTNTTTQTDEQDYENFFDEHVRLTQQIQRLEKSAMALRYADKILELDAQREQVHRRLEEVGRRLGKDRFDILQELVMGEIGSSENELPGFQAYRVGRESGDEGESFSVVQSYDSEGADGMFLAFDTSAFFYDWRTERHSETSYDESYKEWISERAGALVNGLRERFPGEDIAIHEVEEDWSGAAHVDRTRMLGIFVPKQWSREVVGFIQTSNLWPTREEIRERKIELQSEVYDTYGDRGIDVPAEEIANVLGRQVNEQEVKDGLSMIFAWMECNMETSDAADASDFMEVGILTRTDVHGRSVSLKFRRDGESVTLPYQTIEDLRESFREMIIKVGNETSEHRRVQEAEQKKIRELDEQNRREIDDEAWQEEIEQRVQEKR